MSSPDLSASREAIEALPLDYAELTSAIGSRPTPPDGPGAPNKPASTPPINLAIDTLRSRIVYTAAAWEEILRDHCRLSARREGTVRESWSIVQSVRVIAPRVDLLATLPHTDGYFDGAECGLVRRNGLEGLRSLLRLHTLTDDILGRGAITVRLPGLCRCGAEQLRRDVGADTVYCAACAGRWPHAEYLAHVRMSVP